MPPAQLKETTMSPKTRKLLKVTIPKRDINEADKRREVDSLVNILMGKKPELRFKYIQENASNVVNMIFKFQKSINYMLFAIKI